MSDTAWARGRAYALLAKLLLEGLDADTLALVRALPGWLLDDSGDSVDSIDLDRLAAEQHACLQLGVFPHAGVFLDRSAVAGARADLAFEYYERARFRPRLDEVSGDHLGILVAFLAYAAPRRELDPIVAEFLPACVLSWLPALVVAAEALDDAGRFWPRVLHATLELCAEHRLALIERFGPRDQAPELLEPLDLADESTGLRQIAEHLLTPAASGVFLTRSDLAQLGRAHQIPRGFGSRLIMLDNLLRSAVEHGQLSPLLDSLDALLVERAAALDTLAAALSLTSMVAPWKDAIGRTRTITQTLAHAAPERSSGALADESD